MPTVDIDISDQYANLYKDIINKISWGYSDLNPGQIATLEGLEPTISAVAHVHIAGRNVDITVEVDIDFGSYPDYISQTIDNINQTFDLYSDKLGSKYGYDSSKLIEEAFAQL